MDIKDLLGKSLLSLNMEELETLKVHYETDSLTYFEKIESVEKAIRRLHAKLNKPVERPQWEYDAMEMIALIEKWKSLGAYIKSNSSYDKWIYNDIEFYISWSGKYISETIQGARDADKQLMQLIEIEDSLNNITIPKPSKGFGQIDVETVLNIYSDYVNKI